MPYVSNSPISSAKAMLNVSVYLANASHRSHAEYELTPLQVLGAKSVQDFLRYAEKSFENNQQKGRKRRSGRPPKNQGSWIIIRTPDGSWLSDSERKAIEKAAISETAKGKNLVGVMNWHKNQLTGSDDFNLVASAFTESGKLLRDRGQDPIQSLRVTMDKVVRELNSLRKIRGEEPIQTMQDAQKGIRKAKGAKDLVKELAGLPQPPITAEELKPAIESLGIEVTRFNPEKNALSIKKPKQKKASKFRIVELLNQIWDEMKFNGNEGMPMELPKNKEKQPDPLPEKRKVQTKIPAVAPARPSLPKKKSKQNKINGLEGPTMT